MAQQTSNPKKMTARYNGFCRQCGRKILAGTEILYSQDEGATHVDCGEEGEDVAPALSQPSPEHSIRISQGEGYGGRPYQVGQILATADADEWLIVLSASKTYYREDGMSFGVGDEHGYIYSATCRPATPEEAAPTIAERAEAQARRQAVSDLAAEHARIIEEGQPGHSPEGERVNVGEGQTIYGGGEWFVVGPEWIWAVRNNGADGDSWANNNISTGGAGAIGRRVPTTPEIAEQIRTLAARARA